MAARGVTRPALLHGAGGGAGTEPGEGHGEPGSEQRRRMLATHHEHTLWVPWTLILLGAWMVVAPFHLGFSNEELWVRPAGGRGVWLARETHDALRAELVTWSDVLSGIALVLLGWRALRPDRPVSLWLAAGVGAWLSAAPLVLWAPTTAAYLNDTLVGMLVLALTILVPGMPNMILTMRMGGALPPGWTYNPSSWPQRWIMIVLGFLGFLASRYLAMVQLGYLDRAWDPFFGAGTRRVLESSMSRSLPVSDAALGTLAYTFEFLMGFMGGPARWRTMPWMVCFFGVLVIPLGLVHVLLVISQPVVVGAWCTLCLAAAAIMLPMIPLEADEVVAMVQHLRRARRRGEGLWRVFWKGGDPSEAGEDERSPALVELPERPVAVLRASLWGMGAPPTLLASAALGVALMAVPDLLSVAAPESKLFHLGGALAVVAAVVAMGEVLRPLRLLCIPLGAGLALGPWLLAGGGTAAALIGLVGGLALCGLALPRGRIRESYGAWDRLVV